MGLFYAQYASIEPWLKRKDDMKLGEKQLYQSPKERDKLVHRTLPMAAVASLFSSEIRDRFRTVSMSASCVARAPLAALRIGGIRTNISVPLFSCKLTGSTGFLF